MNKLFAYTISVLVAIMLLLWLAIWAMTKHQTSKWLASPPVEVIDGCQYLVCPVANGYFVCSHKGNCTNFIHVLHESAPKWPPRIEIPKP